MLRSPRIAISVSLILSLGLLPSLGFAEDGLFHLKKIACYEERQELYEKYGVDRFQAFLDRLHKPFQPGEIPVAFEYSSEAARKKAEFFLAKGSEELANESVKKHRHFLADVLRGILKSRGFEVNSIQVSFDPSIEPSYATTLDAVVTDAKTGITTDIIVNLDDLTKSTGLKVRTFVSLGPVPQPFSSTYLKVDEPSSKQLQITHADGKFQRLSDFVDSQSPACQEFDNHVNRLKWETVDAYHTAKRLGEEFISSVEAARTPEALRAALSE